MSITLLQLLSFLVPLTILLLFRSLRRRPPFPLPPGPKPLPIVGNVSIMDQLTHRGLARLANLYGGLFHLRLGFLHIVTVSTPEMAKLVLQAHDDIFSNRPASLAITYLTYSRADMAFAHYGPFWRQMRKLCVMRLFSRRRAESWVSVRDEVDSMIQALATKAGSPVNVGELVFNLTMSITFRAAFGERTKGDQEKFVSILQEFSSLFGAFNIGDLVPWLKWFDFNGLNKRMKKARLALDDFIDRIIEEDMRNPKEEDAHNADMVDDMLAFYAEDGHRTARDDRELHGCRLNLTKDNIKAVIMDVMFGGTETVATAIEWAMAELLRNPLELDRVQSELGRVVGLNRWRLEESDLEKLPALKNAVKETLRLHPPIPLLLHEAARDCTLSGYAVPARARVVINVWAIGRDRAAWKDEPDAFKPGRFEQGGSGEAVDFRGGFFELLPFGSGRRSCPGMQLGLYALELAVGQLLHCFNWELAEGIKPSDLPMDDVFGLTAPRAHRLVAVPKPRLLCPL